MQQPIPSSEPVWTVDLLQRLDVGAELKYHSHVARITRILGRGVNDKNMPFKIVEAEYGGERISTVTTSMTVGDHMGMLRP